jgi:hypothetical protein
MGGVLLGDLHAEKIVFRPPGGGRDDEQPFAAPHFDLQRRDAAEQLRRIERLRQLVERVEQPR